MTKMASLVLEDGTKFTGLLFGAEVSVSGEVGESRAHVLDGSVGPVADSPGLHPCGGLVFSAVLDDVCRSLGCHGD